MSSLPMIAVGGATRRDSECLYGRHRGDGVRWWPVAGLGDEDCDQTIGADYRWRLAVI